MAAPESAPQSSRAPSLLGGLGSARTGVQSMPLRSEKESQPCWSSFPMGQKTKGTVNRTSSYLLQQIIHRYQELDADGEEDRGEGEVESEESSDSEMQNLEEEFDGVLREEAVAAALHQLGRSGSGTEQVYLSLTLSPSLICSLISTCVNVYFIGLPYSASISSPDLSCVSYMPYLLELNASQNKLTTFFNFKPPKNLKSWYIGNEIEEISGLEMCNSLTHLSLANNKIMTIDGLNTLPIKILCLSNNNIEKIMGLEHLKALQNLDLSHNQISSLQGLENHDLLEVLNLEDNKVVLCFLCLSEKPEYWQFVIFMLLRLTELDQKKIKVEEKVCNYIMNAGTHLLSTLITLPSLDAPYPMLILAGPEACGKRELAHRLCRQFSTYFRYGACHTTRQPYFGEGDRVDYHFISQEVFDEMLNMGKFILTFSYGNHNYGLSRDTIEGIARDGLASCIHMEIEGVRSLKYSYFEPRYILVVPMNKNKYEGYLRRKGLFSRAEIEFAVSRVDLYTKINQKFPGYFDAVINADDLDVAYQTLSQLIREYLGLTEETAKSLVPAADVKTSHMKSEEPPRKYTSTNMDDFLHSTDRNYFVKLWTKLSDKKTPAVREGKRSEAITQLRSDHFGSRRKVGPVPAPLTNMELAIFCWLVKITVLISRLQRNPKTGKQALPVQSFSHEKEALQQRRQSILVISRPGSNTKPTLPPIPQGRK
uniref:Leucine rich repeats and guanylate kinase domain containing n=1 Tax=Propithecus coquereli TaxID=379532 RepID=A0A2K6G390_PROCO